MKKLFEEFINSKVISVKKELEDINGKFLQSFPKFLKDYKLVKTFIFNDYIYDPELLAEKLDEFLKLKESFKNNHFLYVHEGEAYTSDDVIAPFDDGWELYTYEVTDDSHLLQSVKDSYMSEFIWNKEIKQNLLEDAKAMGFHSVSHTDLLLTVSVFKLYLKDHISYEQLIKISFNI